MEPSITGLLLGFIKSIRGNTGYLYLLGFRLVSNRNTGNLLLGLFCGTKNLYWLHLLGMVPVVKT
jgi:hypothetical protein